MSSTGATAAVLALAATLTACGSDQSDGAAEAAYAGTAPRAVSAQICGSRGLAGPAKPPRGATVIRHQNLGKVVNRSRPGTTFWIAPGTHTLGHGPYDQVRPKNGQSFIGAPAAVLDGQGLNLYAFVGTAKNVTIEHLTITHFGKDDDNTDQGVVNHDSGAGWRIAHNTISHSSGAGVFLGDRTKVVSNCLTRNGQYGFSAYQPHGVRHIVLRHNEISHNNTWDYEAHEPGCGCEGGGKFWDVTWANVVGNYVHDNNGPGLWADTNNRGFLFKRNVITGNSGEGLFYEISYNAKIVHNVFRRNAIPEGRTGTDFTEALYLSESGSDSRAGKRFGRHLVVAHNLFVDNWAGITAWENPDRFAGSPNNSSTGYTTRVAPGVATLANCSNPALVGTKPYFGDCRWKVRHLRVMHNRFVIDRSHIKGCTVKAGCGLNSLVSNYGTSPSWSPYKGWIVPNNITFHQGNVWRHNTYVGSWKWQIHTLNHVVSWRKWRGAPYHQDSGSVRR